MLSNKRISQKVWIEVSSSALIHNLLMFRKKIGKRKIYCVVKANAYGHGLEEVVRTLDIENVYGFAVDNIDEAMTIKKLGIRKPILILGYTILANLKKAIKNGFSVTIYSLNSLKFIRNLNIQEKAKLHLKLETGLNRQGIKGKKLTEVVEFIKKNEKHFILEGVSSHFADIEDTIDSSYSKIQLGNFRNAIYFIQKKGLKPIIKHCACSAAAILYPETYFDAVRVGISLYGLWPSKETKLAYSLKYADGFKLLPVLMWKSVIAQIKVLNKGESVGYGRSWYASKKCRIAVVPVGYSDGYDRGLSNIGRVIIKDSYAPVIGRIAMNMMVLDISDIGNVKEEDEVILIGELKGKSVEAEEIAQKLGTINYEVVSRINPKIKRILVK